MKDRVTVTWTPPGLASTRGATDRALWLPLSRETLAAAMIQLSFWKPDRILVDPCCGSGTILIEAAMIGRNIAPGLSRHFAAEGGKRSRLICGEKNGSRPMRPLTGTSHLRYMDMTSIATPYERRKKMPPKPA